jgi:hypothetical protein
MLVTNADRFVTLRRNTAYVLDAITAAASLALTRQPVREGLLRVTVAGGTTGSGTVTVTGTVAGVAGTSEVVTFTANGTKETVKRFTAISAIATSGLADEATKATVSIQNVGPDGTPQAQAYDVATGIPVRPQKGSGKWGAGAPGTERDQGARWRLDDWEVWTPRVGDHLYDEDLGQTWLVQEVGREMEGLGYFWTVRATRL